MTELNTMHCTECGAVGQAGCACGKPYAYIPALQAAKLAHTAHPDWTNRKIAKVTGISLGTVNNAVKSVEQNCSTEKRTGNDGKQYPARKPSREKEVADAMGIKITHKPPAREYPKRSLTYIMNILREVIEYSVCYSPEELGELERLCEKFLKAIANHRTKEGNVTWLRQSSNT